MKLLNKFTRRTQAYILLSLSLTGILLGAIGLKLNAGGSAGLIGAIASFLIIPIKTMIIPVL